LNTALERLVVCACVPVAPRRCLSVCARTFAHVLAQMPRLDGCKELYCLMAVRNFCKELYGLVAVRKCCKVLYCLMAVI
jgi:hypothetical protein